MLQGGTTPQTCSSPRAPVDVVSPEAVLSEGQNMADALMLRFNDAAVDVVSPEAVLNERQNMAYILMYQRVRTP
eukprot:1161133-Pelagomonas_calceolata.AAC.23